MKIGVRGLAFLLLQATSYLVIVHSGTETNPPVIRMMFRNSSVQETTRPLAITADTAHNHSDIPLVYCLDSQFPDDVFCDVRDLLSSGMFAESMLIKALTMDVQYPENENMTCGLQFFNDDERKSLPLLHEKIECGFIRDRPTISVRIVKDGLDEILEQFSVKNVTDMIITSYTPGFGCRYRLKPFEVSESAVTVYNLDSFYCMINFGSFDPDAIPETEYRHGVFYKHDGERWEPKGIWPDYY